MYNTDPITTLTNQPETGAIPSLTLSRAAGRQGVGADIVFDEYWPGGAKLAEVEAAMTPALLLIMALGPGKVVAAGGRSNSQ
eukprot:scaffold41487_cov100-Cyclotella_meneghiniana.AAC.3